jgi:hypothetical protein
MQSFVAHRWGASTGSTVVQDKHCNYVVWKFKGVLAHVFEQSRAKAPSEHALSLGSRAVAWHAVHDVLDVTQSS